MSSLDPSYSTAGTAPLTSARSSFWRRFGASFIDAILIGVVALILRALLGATASSVLTFVLAAGYFTYFHGTTGQSPGDAALSIRVVDKDGGGVIGYARAFVRWLVSEGPSAALLIGAIASEPVSGVFRLIALLLVIGYLWMIWDSEKQTWHDKAANSVVVPTVA
jgi:uncharacterized RDD family membrane protein YckC